jgi:hypothetical protein
MDHSLARELGAVASHAVASLASPPLEREQGGAVAWSSHTGLTYLSGTIIFGEPHLKGTT